MAVGLLLEQCAGLLQRLDDGGVGVLENVQPLEGTRLRCESAGFVNGAEHGQAVLLAGLKVVDSMPRSGVHQPCSGLGGDVFAADHHRAGAIQQRMSINQVGQQSAFHRGAAAERKRQCCGQSVNQVGGHQQQPAVSIVGQGVIQPFVHGHRQVGRDGPGGGGPDRHLQGPAELRWIAGELDPLSIQDLPQS